jgi:hypothetical protein
MKLFKKTEIYVFIILIAGLLLASCQKDDNLDPDPQPNPNVDANKITESLKFRNGTIISGDIPKSVNSKNAATVADLKIDTDTIFWVEGVINRIKILKPESLTGLVGTFWAQVEGSDSYIDAEFEVEQENDTLVFLNFEFDPTGYDLPLSFDITIAPKDDADGAPIDKFELPVVIEEPIESSSNGGEDYWQGTWHWMETTIDGMVHTKPYDNIKQDATTGLCCSGSNSFYFPCTSNDPNYTEMGFTIDYFVIREFLHFSEISDVRGELREMSNNLDWENSNICNNEPAYIGRTVHNSFTGTFTKIDSHTRTLSNIKGQEEEIFIDNISLGFVPLPIYVGSGSFVEYKLLSKHYLKEVRNNPEGGPGGGIERLYYKRFIDPDLEFVDTIWFDICGVCI